MIKIVRRDYLNRNMPFFIGIHPDRFDISWRKRTMVLTGRWNAWLYSWVSKRAERKGLHE